MDKSSAAATTPNEWAADNRFNRLQDERKQRRVAMWDRAAPARDQWRQKNAAYYQAIERFVRFIVPEGASVLEIGTGTGDLLAALKPSEGVGIDISGGLLEIARQKHPELEFSIGDAESLDAVALGGRTFEYVVMSDVVGELFDVWSAFRALRRVCNSRTRVVITYYNFVWEPVLRLGEKIGWKMPIEQQNWLGMQDLQNLLELNHFEIIRSGMAQVLPLNLPVIAPLTNRYLARLPASRPFALTEYFVCKLAKGGGPIPSRDYTCSVIVPCKDERGNIDEIIARTPHMGRGTEIIFVDGNSTYGTVYAIQGH
jgi:SAM-dependent methyltransferase